MNKQGGEKRGLKIVFIIAAIAFVIMYAIVQAGVLSNAVRVVVAVITPILIGVAVAYILNPLLRFFEFKVFKKMKNKNLNRSLSMILTYVVAAIVMAVLVYILVPRIIDSVEEVVRNHDKYITTTTGLINGILNKVLSNEETVEYVKNDDISKALVSFLTGSDGKEGEKTIAEYIKGLIPGYVAPVFGGVTDVIIGIFISIYVLHSKEKLQAQARKIGVAFLPEQKVSVIGKYINITHTTFTKYFVGKIFSSVCIMMIMLVLMLVFRMKYAILVAFIIGITDIIPIFGPIIGAVPSFIIVFTSSGPKEALIFLLLILVVQQIEGNIIAPKILGDATGISSLWVIISIIIMGECFGFIGMLIGVPVFAVGTIIIKEIVETRLRKKEKPTQTEEYYLEDAIVDPYNDHHLPIITKIVLKIKRSKKKHDHKHEDKAQKPDDKAQKPDDNKENKE